MLLFCVNYFFLFLCYYKTAKRQLQSFAILLIVSSFKISVIFLLKMFVW